MRKTTRGSHHTVPCDIEELRDIETAPSVQWQGPKKANQDQDLPSYEV